MNKINTILIRLESTQKVCACQDAMYLHRLYLNIERFIESYFKSIGKKISNSASYHKDLLTDYFKTFGLEKHDTFWEDMDRNLIDKNLMIEESFKNFAEDYFAEDFFAEDFLDEKYTLCEKCMGKFLDNIFYNSKTKLGKSLSNLDRLL